ncbi:MAG: hypothetical protein JWM87_239 [Candidatus Eremiobacteraeota bacterium]|nr:hypothetical protein [Candidatus Eremiobacteraeota bacterium]
MNRQFDADALTALVPLIYRTRDAELAGTGRKGPLQSLIEVLAGEIAVLEDGLGEAYDDLFIETCAPWVVPYIGDLIGYVALPGKTALSERAQVAHLLAYRRRKGTLAMLHQSIADTTGWGTLVVEYLHRVALTQSMARAPFAPSIADVRRTASATPADELFAPAKRTVDVRRIEAGRGRYGTANVGVHLWRLRSYPLRDSAPAPAAGHHARAFHLHPAGVDTQLFAFAEDARPFSGGGSPDTVPIPLSRDRLRRELHVRYGADRDVLVVADGRAIPPAEIEIGSLAGRTRGAWPATLPDRFCIDPELGRLVVPHYKNPVESVRVSFCYGFSADAGGGPYERSATLDESDAGSVRLVHGGSNELAAQLRDLAPDTVVELTASSRFDVPPDIELAEGAHLTLRAAEGVWPVLAGTEPLRVIGKRGSRLTLSGVLIPEAGVLIDGELDQVRILDCTIVPPGRRHGHTAVTLGAHVRRALFARCVMGPIVADEDVELELDTCIVDAGSRDRPAIGQRARPAGPLSVRACTVVGDVDTVLLAEASNTLFDGEVRSQRFQDGCVRYSYLAPGSVVPQRFMCLPHHGERKLIVHMTSRHYGAPGYMQLSAQTSRAIRHGADDGEEIGVFHAVSTAGREAALHAVLEDAVPIGIQLGIRYMT